MTTPYEIGSQVPQPDARGWLVFRYLPPNLQRYEDQTYAADSDRLRHEEHTWSSTTWLRPATDTEKYLLAHLGYDVPEILWTRVEYKTASLRHRSWPILEENAA
jgi:hypothetical protein